MTNLRMNILIAEPMPAAGIELLTPQPGWNVIVSNPEEYREHLADADALIVRNAVKVDAELLAAAPQLKVIGKGGHRRRQYRLRGRDRGGRPGDEYARRQCGFGGRTYAGADARDGAVHSAGGHLD